MEMKTPKMEIKEEEVEEGERRMKKWPLMKAAQFLEFQMQALVYRYIEAGLRVPPHLVVPIWKSLALSSPSSASSYLIHHNQLSSSMLGGKVELEPTRCRRTDGKKWRCSNTVLPSEKYCERHMHRGRKRSRKLVESSCYDVASTSVSSIKQEDARGFESNNESQRVSHGTMSVSSDAQVVTVASLPVARVSESVTRAPLIISESTSKSVNHRDRRRKYMEMSYNDFIKQRESSTRIRVRIPVADEERLPSVQKLFPEVSDISLDAARYRKNDIIARSREWKNVNVNGGYFPGIHFASPDTVLQDRGGFGIHRVETDNEPGRCRRTDGKKWRCSKEVSSGEKYCDKHMNRGVRKKDPVDTNNSTDNSGFSPLTMKPAATSASCDDGQVQKLSVSFLGVPLYQVPDEKVTSGCSTDTTITDTDLMGKEDYEEVLSLCSSGV